MRHRPPHTGTGTRAACERGFTLVELVVAVFLFGVAMALLIPAVGNLSGFANRAAADSSSAGDARAAVQMLEADLRGAHGPTRTVSDRVDLASTRSVIYDLNNQGAGRDRRHDLLLVGPRALRFWADVCSRADCNNGAAPEEVVTWYLLTRSATCDFTPSGAAGQNWCIVRDVQRNPAGGLVSREVVARGNGAYPSDQGTCDDGGVSTASGGIPPTRLFCYRWSGPASGSYAWDEWSNQCVESWDNPVHPVSGVELPWNTSLAGPDALWDGGRRVFRGWAYTRGGRIDMFHEPSPPTRTTVYAADRITAVGLVTPAFSRQQGERGSKAFTTYVTLRNRDTPEYRTAILCGER